jgi:predicted esterase
VAAATKPAAAVAAAAAAAATRGREQKLTAPTAAPFAHSHNEHDATCSAPIAASHQTQLLAAHADDPHMCKKT